MIEYKMEHPYDFIYHFRDPQGVCFSIIKGTTLSLVVDTGYGIGDIKKTVEAYIDTPYKVICTHGHMDHTGGCGNFEKVYIPNNDYSLYVKHNKREIRMRNLSTARSLKLIDDSFNDEEYLKRAPKKIELFKVGEIFDLGNHQVEVINMEGHTKGSIGLLVKDAKILFTGDAAIHNIWLFLGESTDKQTYIKMLEQTLKLDFDKFITGHLMPVFDKKVMEYYLQVAKEANVNNSKPTTFNNFERPNTYQYSKQFGDLNIGICFQEPKEN